MKQSFTCTMYDNSRDTTAKFNNKDGVKEEELSQHKSKQNNLEEDACRGE